MIVKIIVKLNYDIKIVCRRWETVSRFEAKTFFTRNFIAFFIDGEDGRREASKNQTSALF